MANKNKKCFRHGRLLVVLDRNEVFPDDPGAGAPAMVHSFQFSATYWCAQENGLVASDGTPLDLTAEEVDWLGSIDADVTDFLYRQPAQMAVKGGA